MLNFTKMQSLGNDFVMIDAVRQPVSLTPGQLRYLADRNHGIGCDQVLLAEPATVPNADFRFRIYNADGSEAGHCGNGARCFARYLQQQGLTDKSHIRIEIPKGLSELEILADGTVCVDMGVPGFEPAAIPLRQDAAALDYPLSVCGRELRFAAMSMGNPHAVVQVDNVDDFPMAELGPAVSNHELFPDRCNAGFMQVESARRIRLRVYERGAGETQACGSGACACRCRRSALGTAAGSGNGRIAGRHAGRRMGRR